MSKIKKIKSPLSTFLQITQNSMIKVVYLIGILLILYISWEVGQIIYEEKDYLEKLADLSQLLVGYTAIFAIGQFIILIRDNEDKKTKIALELVKFFREEILNTVDEIQKGKTASNIPLIHLRKNTPFLDFTEKSFFEKIEPNRKRELEQYIEIIKENKKIENLTRGCLNACEELAIGIVNSNLEEHPAISSVKKPFIQIIEYLAIPLYHHIGLEGDGFPYISQIYTYWKKELGFIPMSSDDKLEVIKERRERYQQV